ncbi:unknown [Crocosphaera subtropica ATCC 51142]|uniref:Zinc metalloprotease n=1 Tax=Crocosphaera subtropica (strain ATCC 51142 / BH68) TaxID=43989 RepID=B1WRM6_CROS5|nr:site-2 protease family protein [Crocosphaera subtropica]ACB53467.1 unknown [Crocosphaera subtropica ATCC 51142]
MDGKWQIGSLLGIPLYIDSSWFFILGLVTLVNSQEITQLNLVGNLWWLAWIAGLILALLLFISVLLHELGHSLVALAQGINVNSITLFLFGGVAAIEKESENPIGAFWVAIAGPLVSLGLSVLLFTLLYSLPSRENLDMIGRLSIYMMEDIARINLVLGIFNLIPGLPLDGGQVLKAIIWKLKGDRFTGVRWAAASGQLIGWLGISFGLLIILLTGTLSGLWIVFIGWFVRRNAENYQRITQLQESLLTITAREVMTREFRVINAHLTLTQFAQDYLLSELHDAMVYFAASEGRYRGLIVIDDLQDIERSQWDILTLWDIVHPLNTIPSVGETTPVVTIIEKLEAINQRYITVLSPAGAVAGIIDRGDIVKAIAAYHQLPIPETEIKRIKEEGTYPSYLQLPAIAKTLDGLESVDHKNFS